MYKDKKETKTKEYKDRVETRNYAEKEKNCREFDGNRHKSYCVRHNIEFSVVDNAICPECIADFWIICDADLGTAKDRVRIIKAGLTKDFPKRLEDLYIEQKGIRFVGDRSKFRAI